MEEKEEEIKNNKIIDKTKEWLCEKCQNINTNDMFRCCKCNYFNYDVFSGNYQKSNNKKENKTIKNNESKPIILENKNIEKKVTNPIFLEDNYIDYNDKEDYEFKREEKHKFNKCWHCGRENIYYKIKCNYCRFPINDSKEPKIKKTQLTQYDILHGITFDNKTKIVKNNNKYKEIEIKYNPFKEEIKYKNLGQNWTCKFCHKKNNESIKFCSYCYKNRL